MSDEGSDKSAELREQMVRKQIEGRGISDPAVLQAMRDVPREEFVPEHLQEYSYGDSALPIDCGQTISQPFTVAFMCDAAKVQPGDKVLEIGAGSGYGAAVLSRLCGEVHTVERVAELAEQAAARLDRLGFHSVHVHQDDGSLGLPSHAPFDVIIVTAGAAELPIPYADQLNEGGRIVIPLGDMQQRQTMCRFTRTDGRLQQERLGGFAFVPLIGKHGWPD